jgi:hypothetical protein
VEGSALPHSPTKEEPSKMISGVMFRMAERSENDGDAGLWRFLGDEDRLLGSFFLRRILLDYR